MAHHQIDELDEKILKMILNDARIPFLEVARVCNISGAAVHQRVQKLIDLRILKGSEFIIDYTKIGYETSAYMGLCLKNPEKYQSVVDALIEIPEIIECHYTTGHCNIFIKLRAKNNKHLLEIIHHKLQPLGLAQMETLISYKEVFKRQMPVKFDINRNRE